MKQREIKFRIWNGAVMYEPFNLIELFGVGSNYVQVVERNDNGDKVLSNGYEIMQFTGLLDKNGKEIYEGDILMHTNGDKSVMRWIEDFACFAGVLFLEDEHQYYQKIDGKKLEIIGNVYENPDLLTK